MGTHDRERETHVREFVMVEQAALRRRMEAAIDSMLALLDELDGDPDLEPDNDDEPSLGWPANGPRALSEVVYPERGAAPCDCEYDDVEEAEGDFTEDLEPEDEGDPDMELEGDPEEDREPALGWNAEASQAVLMGTPSACEDEPSLGSTEGLEPAAARSWDGYRWSRAKGIRRFRLGSQEHWGSDGRGEPWAVTDAEEEFDGREDDGGREDDDNGVADRDGMQEQFGGYRPNGYVGVL